MDSVRIDNTFIPNPIQNLIISYLNLHEFYIKELKEKTVFIFEKLSGSDEKDFSCGFKVITKKDDIKWIVEYPYSNSANKYKHILDRLNKRSNRLNENFGIRQANLYGLESNQKPTNKCYINY